jgi:peptidoglycan/LPS O-acetylase OafA/YrhL
VPRVGTRAKPRSTWPAVAACALAGAVVVAALLLPLDATARTWTVRGVLVALAIGACVRVVARDRVTPTRANRPERIAFQVVFFWAFFTGLTFAVPIGDPDPRAAVIGGAIAGVLFGVVVLALDPWVVQRSAPPRSQ